MPMMLLVEMKDKSACEEVKELEWGWDVAQVRLFA